MGCAAPRQRDAALGPALRWFTLTRRRSPHPEVLARLALHVDAREADVLQHAVVERIELAALPDTLVPREQYRQQTRDQADTRIRRHGADAVGEISGGEFADHAASPSRANDD